MPSEYKIRIDDLNKFNLSLAKLGARRIKHSKIKDIYYKQPQGTVLKIRSEDGQVDRIVHFRKTKNGFEKINIPDLPIAELGLMFDQKYQIDKIIEKEVSRFKVDDIGFSMHSIVGVGDFLVLEREPCSFVEKQFNVARADFFSTPFNEL